MKVPGSISRIERSSSWPEPSVIPREPRQPKQKQIMKRLGCFANYSIVSFNIKRPFFFKQSRKDFDLDDGAVVEEDEDHGQQVVEQAHEDNVASIVLERNGKKIKILINLLNLILTFKPFVFWIYCKQIALYDIVVVVFKFNSSTQ